ncbi:MAG: transposase [Deltaproteobacteria bacterium]|nr:transposase [Deltaproteobacteria bacterium]
MARPPRTDFPGAWHHVMHRGRRRERIFEDSHDLVAFFDIVADTVRRFGIEVHAYSLMPNHYHLLVRSPLGNLSRTMRHLDGVYTQRHNVRHRRDGALFRGRFRSQLVRDETRLPYIAAYIHLNPVRAGLVTRVDSDRAWTSHREHMGRDAAPEWLSTAFLRERIGSARAIHELVLDMARGRRSWPEGMDLGTGWMERGDDGEGGTILQRTRSVQASELLKEICEIAGVGRARLSARVRGPKGNPERRFAVWALARSTDLTQAAIGRLLGMSAMHVAQDLRRMRGGWEPMDGWRAAWEERHPAVMSSVKV